MSWTLATTDELTGLLNRRRLKEEGAREVELSRRLTLPLAVLLLDLDHFKEVNDTHGHPAGDAVLRAFAATAANQLRSCDLLSRYGGEELVAVLPGVRQEDALVVGERLRQATRSLEVTWEGLTLRVTVSCGVYAAVAAEGQDLDDYLRRADLALYRAKLMGRDRVVGA